ncbi:MAG: GMC family oxidoreductase [Proteobacteria bacterium]|nr:GMC family oxidoreductase [Pseudomonadota bacterium]
MRTLKVQDVIVGSGAAGGVLAHRLSRAGRSVALVEEGPEVSKADFTQREDQMYALLHRDAGGQATVDGGVAVLQGRCLGGSTTVNMGDCVPITDGVIDHWRQHFGWGDWGGISNADIHAAAAAVQADMGAGPIPEDMVNKANDLLRQGAGSLGMAGEILHHNRVGCIGAGYCTIGCAYDAKRGTLVAHIPAAREAGCELLCDALVDRVILDGSRAVGVEGPGFRVDAERVFLCAGAIHTCGILHRSGHSSDAVGANLSLQPQAPLVAIFPEEVRFFRGVPQSYAVVEDLTSDADHGLGGFTLEGVSTGPALASSMIPGTMAELIALMSRYAHMAASLCLVPDRPGGRVVWGDRPRPTIKYTPSDDHQRRLRAAIKAASRCYLAAGAERVIGPAAGCPEMRSEADLAAIDTMSMRSSDLPMISAHPQGSCRMAPDAFNSVVDMDFRVRGVDGVWLCDASIFPTTASTHTMVPVMSMAHLLAQQVLS